VLKKTKVTPVRILDSTSIVEDLKFLASDSCEGRAPGSQGHELAMQRIVDRMRKAGIDSFDNSFLKGFTRYYHHTPVSAANIVGYVRGRSMPDSFVIVTAHYDHLGKIGDS